MIINELKELNLSRLKCLVAGKFSTAKAISKKYNKIKAESAKLTEIREKASLPGLTFLEL